MQMNERSTMNEPMLVRGMFTTVEKVMLWLAFIAGVAAPVIGVWVFFTTDAGFLVIPVTLALGVLVGGFGAVTVMLRRRSRVWVTDHGDSITVTDALGTRTYKDEQLVGAALFEKNRTMGGRGVAVWLRCCHLWFDDSDQPIKMEGRLRDDRPDMLVPLIERLVNGLMERCEAAITEGGGVTGDGWLLSPDGLSFRDAHGGEQFAPYAHLAATDVFDNAVCVWSVGQELPFLKIDVASCNALMFVRLLAARIPERDESEVPHAEGSLGRLLFERKASFPAVAGLLVVSVIALLVAAGCLLFLYLVAVAIAMLVGVICALAAMESAIGCFSCHERGVRKRSMFGTKELLYEDLMSFTYGATHMYYNGAYTGTQIAMQFTPFPESGKKAIRYNRQVKVSDDSLDSLRDHISGVIASNMAKQLEESGQTQWTKHVTFTADAFVFRQQGFVGRKEPVALPYEAVSGINMVEGQFMVFGEGDKPAITIQASEENFWPGFVLFQAMFGGGGEEATEDENAA